MSTNIHIPATAELRAEQVMSWAFQSVSWGSGVADRGIDSHYSANALLEAVEDDEKPSLLAAWAEGCKQGSYQRLGG